MIAFVEGIPEVIESDYVVLNVGGVGYRVFTPVTRELLDYVQNGKNRGEKMRFYTYLNVREDCMLLYGFTSEEALSIFKLLINVNGVGPKSALSFFTVLSVEDLIRAVAAEDTKTLSSVPGIGAKTAARIVLDLKDKLGQSLTDTSSVLPAESLAPKAQTAVQKDTVTALISLGYSAKEAENAVLKASEHHPDKIDDSSALLGAALRYM